MRIHNIRKKRALLFLDNQCYNNKSPSPTQRHHMNFSEASNNTNNTLYHTQRVIIVKLLPAKQQKAY